MQQWRASLKRPDLTEEDRVKGALEAYCRQAFAIASLPTLAMRQAADRMKPFAEAADSYDPDEGDGRNAAWAHDFIIGSLRAALQSEKDREGGE